MSNKIKLYTPSTGFPDLEAKIAYGLARVGIEAYGSKKVKILPQNGYYAVEIQGDIKKLNATFKFLCNRFLQSDIIFLDTPGIKRSGKKGKKGWNLLAREDEEHLLNKYLKRYFSLKNKKEEPLCHHPGNKIGIQIGFSASTSYHHSRDRVDISKDKRGFHRPTTPKKLCKTCGLLAILGTWFASFIFNIGKKEVIVTPIPEKEIGGNDLEKIFSLHHSLRGNNIPDIPFVLIPLVFLSKIPSTAEILRNFRLFVALLSRSARVYHVDGISSISIENYLGFLTNPYNVATIDRMIATFGNKKYTREAYDAMTELNNAIYYEKKDSLLKFARLYVQETSPKKVDWTNFLYRETAYYLLRKIGMIRKEIIENGSINSIASTIRYFIRERKYHYADNIRNARKNSKEFENTIIKMLREARLRWTQEEKKKKSGKSYKFVNIPNDKEIKELVKLANENFDDVKIALVMLAFSFPTRKEEIEEIEEEMKNA